MNKMSLNGDNWRMEILGEADVYGVNGRELPAEVPGSVYGNLLRQGLMPDPYDGMNELEALRLMENDFRFWTVFTLTEEQLAGDFLFLRFDGIDTLAEVYLNGRLLGCADNMHRIWEFSIEEAARAGKNELRVEIASPTRFIARENEKIYTGGSGEAMVGFPHLRKAHCMFGWDWGPRLPDAGIFREVSVLSGQKARIEQVYITKNWGTTDKTAETETGSMLSEETAGAGNTGNAVDITFHIEIEDFTDGDAYVLRTALYDPDGVLIAEKSSKEPEGTGTEKEQTKAADCAEQSGDWDTITVKNPKRWWPNGFGEQPLTGRR